jgi:hypothetical protein
MDKTTINGAAISEVQEDFGKDDLVALMSVTRLVELAPILNDQQYTVFLNALMHYSIKVVGWTESKLVLTAEKVAAEPVAWFTDDSQSDRSATTWDRNVADRWRAKGWPVHPLYAAPQPAQTQVALTVEDLADELENMLFDLKNGHDVDSREYARLIVAKLNASHPTSRDKA